MSVIICLPKNIKETDLCYFNSFGVKNIFDIFAQAEIQGLDSNLIYFLQSTVQVIQD